MAPTLLGNFSMSMDMHEVSAAAPPIAEVVLSKKQKTVKIVVLERLPQNLRQ